MKKKVLLVHHTLKPPGGGQAVAAWALEGLRHDYDVTLLTWQMADLNGVNRGFGTSLEKRDFRWIAINPILTKILNTIPLPLALLSMNIIFRKAKALNRQHRYDAVVSMINEIDIGVPAIQYIHYPWAKFPRPDADYRWYHFSIPLRLYRWASAAVSGYLEDNVGKNITLVNSDWTGRVFEQYYDGAPSRTLYPPVPGKFPKIEFSNRENGFVCVGRLSPEKELEKLITILAGVHQRGHQIRFHIIGHADDPGYVRRVQAAAAPHESWIQFHFDMPRDEMVALIARNRYGVHGMVGEHFGIAPAELQRAGCVTFVPDDGGVVEIVGRDERVIYHDVDDAIDKIDRVLSDAPVRQAVVDDLQKRKELFSETRFMDELVAVVEEVTG